MKNILYIVLIIAIVAIIIFIGRNWNIVKDYFSQPAPDSGSTQETPDPRPNTSKSLKVTNPNGAYMYYQSLSQSSQGMIYGKSNVLIPPGTELGLIKTWQTNLSTQPFAGYYETNYKIYGPESGFFDIKDLQ